VLDDVMDELEDDDREAVLLRYFQNRPFAEIARVIGLSEDAARKRVDRAVERLRSLLRQHGITSTSAALATVLANETALAAPATLANTIVGAAVANSVAGGTAILTSAAKLWIGIAAAAAIGGAAGVVSQQRTIAELRENETHVRQQMAKLSIENAISVKAQASTERELDALRTELAAAQSAVSGVRRTTASNQPNNSSASAAPSSGNTAQPKDRWHGRFEGFVRQRGLTPDQADRFYEILGQWDDTSRDFQASVRAQGLMATPATQKLRDQLQQQLEVEPLIALLGRDGERAYFEFEGNVFYQAMVDPVAQRLANANLPLTDDEKSQLVALVKSNVHSIKRDPTSMSSEAVVDWTPVVASAGNFLKPSQVDQLKAYASRQHEGVR
jgi:DNA-binding Lrp family transcriptional regulator